MSFRQYGGVNYAARNNIVKNNFTNANNLSVMTKVGQPSSVINFESDISGNTIYGPYDFIGDVTITGNLSVSENTNAYQIHLTGGINTYNTDSNSVVPKSYVDSISAGLRPTVPCQLATKEDSSPLTLPLYGLQTIDGILTQVGYRVLLNNQGYSSGPPATNVASIDNGIYVVNSGAWTRALDCSGNNVQGQSTFIQLGATNAKNTFVQIATSSTSTSPVIAGTNALLYVVYNSLNLSLGDGLKFTNSNTVIQVDPNLSSPAFITSLTVGNGGIYTTDNFTSPTAALKLISFSDGKNYIESGTSTTSGSADLCFTSMNGGTPWMTIQGSTGNVGIGTSAPSKKLEVVGGDALINGLTVGKGNGGIDTNTAVGYQALSSNTTQNFCTAVGYNSSYSQTGSSNTSVGYNALFGSSGSSGSSNTAIGESALFSNTSGSSNTAIGLYSLKNNTTGYNNTAVGYYALNANGLSYSNTAIGYNALAKNTGPKYNIGGYDTDNTAVGNNALYNNTTGYWNTGIGLNALYFNVTGSFNTAIGLQAGVNFNNVGTDGGPTNCDHCTFIGSNTGVTTYTNNFSYSTAIGYSAQITASNQIMMGTASQTVNIPGGLKYTCVGIEAASGTNNITLSSFPLNQYYFVNSKTATTNIYLPYANPNDINLDGITVTFRRYIATQGDIYIYPASGNFIVSHNKLDQLTNMKLGGGDVFSVTYTLIYGGWYTTVWVV